MFCSFRWPKNIGKTILNLLKKNGVAIIEVQYLLKNAKDFTFDNIYHNITIIGVSQA